MADQRFRLKLDKTPWLTVDGETVVLDPMADAYAGVNASGTVLWTALLTGATRAQLLSLLSDAYEVDAEQARIDVDAFLADLSSRGLLVGDADAGRD